MAFLAYDDLFLEHDTGPGHPESPDRLVAIVDHLTSRGLFGRARRIELRPATREELALAHDEDHIARMAGTEGRSGRLDPDTRVGPRSHDAALLAAGSLLAATDEVMGGGETRGMCLVRPPGHHAERGRAMGFCLYDNVAICARYAQRRHGIERVAIVDFDVHHGNGTQDVFKDDESVFYLSLHRYPFFPGSGGPADGGDAPVATLNVPLPGGTPREVYHEAFDRALERVEAFAPEFLVLSAGFDAHRDDPIGGLGLTAADFGLLTEKLVALAERTAKGRVVSALEGGYGLRALGPCVEAHLTALDTETGSIFSVRR